MDWRTHLNDDPLPWLLESDNPSVCYFALTDLLDRPADDPDVVAAKAAINTSRPVKNILDAMYPAGYWVKPGAGYSPKYRSTHAFGLRASTCFRTPKLRTAVLGAAAAWTPLTHPTAPSSIA
jgi:hypothetical protein